MKKVLFLSIVALGTTAFAANQSFKVHLPQDSTIEGKTLKAGDYKVSVENGTAVLSQGKDSVELPAHQETSATKNPSTVLVYKDGVNLHEIRVKGTQTKIIFESAAPGQSGL